MEADEAARRDGSALSEVLGPTVEDATARDVKNRLALSGLLDCAFKAVVESNEPDAIRAEIVALERRVESLKDQLQALRSAPAVLTVAGQPGHPKFGKVFVGPPAFTETIALDAGTKLYATPPTQDAPKLTKTDLARIWRQVNGSPRWPSDVDAFVNALLATPKEGSPT